MKPTTCDHNAANQALVIGRPVTCRMCGAELEPDPACVSGAGIVGGGAVSGNNTQQPAPATKKKKG